MAGRKKSTSFDIAQLVGVSQPTVSRALSGSPMVSAATRARVEAAARQLNYAVDRSASGLRSGRSRTLALLVFQDPQLELTSVNPFFLAMLGSMMSTCGAHKHDLLISFQQLSSDWHTDYEDSNRADGLILLGYGDYADYRGRLDRLVAQGTHFVRWGSVEAGQPGLTLGCDNVAGGALATRHLIARGCRKIAFLGTANDHYPEFRDRYRGYASALREHGLAVDPALQIDAVSAESEAASATTRLLAGELAFDGIVAASDLIALTALQILTRSGLRVPEEVRVIGFDDIPAAALGNPPLTTVTQDAAAAGRILVEMLIDQIAGIPATSTVLPTHLVVRRSTGEE